MRLEGRPEHDDICCGTQNWHSSACCAAAVNGLKFFVTHIMRTFALRPAFLRSAKDCEAGMKGRGGKCKLAFFAKSGILWKEWGYLGFWRKLKILKFVIDFCGVAVV